MGKPLEGKCFYIELEGTGKMPVLHFGMTGMLQVYLHLSLRGLALSIYFIEGTEPGYPSLHEENAGF